MNMKPRPCSHDRSEVVLLYYDELPEDREADVRARLSVCPSCREVMTGLEAVAARVPRRPTVHVEDDAMEAIRRSTSSRLSQHRRSAGLDSRALWSGLFLRPAFAGPAVALLAVVAFLVGLFMRPVVIEAPQTAGADRDIMYVSGISVRDDGTLAVSYSAAAEETVYGSMEDPFIQSLLGRALLDQSNPVTRLRAANAIADIDTGGGFRTDPDLTLALATVLAEDDNVGLKLQAMQAASNLHPALPLPETMIDVLEQILQTEANSALRIQALMLLTESEIASMRLESILESAQDDSNSFVRLQARDRLRQLGEAVPLEQMESGRE